MYELDQSAEAKEQAAFLHRLGGWDGKPFRPTGMIGPYPVIEVDELPPETVS